MDKSAIFRYAQLAATQGRKHEHHKRTVDYANKLRALVTGDEDAADLLLRQFVRRESDAEFAQRKALTRLITPEICNRIEVPFGKGSRADGVTITASRGAETFDVQASLLDRFYGKKSVRRYLDEIVRPVRRTDPNAFLVLEFADFDSNTEKPRPYPVIFSGENCLDYQFNQDDIVYLTVKDGERFITYFKGGSFLIEIRESATPAFTESADRGFTPYERVVDDLSNGVTVKVGDKFLYLREYDNGTAINPEDQIGTGRIQAARIGYLYDEKTGGKTCVSHIHPAINRIERAIAANSESDLSHALHAFPQKIMQARPCPGYNDIDEHGNSFHVNCQSGYELGTNKSCRSCGGSGIQPVHSSAQDVIMVEVGRGDANPDLDNVVKYAAVDIETPKYLEEFIARQAEECMKAVFAGNHFSTLTGAATATEVRVDYESVYDAIYPYNQHTEELFEFCVETRAAIQEDIRDLQVEMRFPKDLGIQSMTELLNDYKTAADSGAPMELVSSIRKRIIHKRYSDQPLAMLDAEIAMSHEPFAGKSTEAIQYIVSNNLTPKSEQVKWANYELILARVKKKAPNFIQMTADKREEMINTEVKLLMEEISPEMPI